MATQRDLTITTIERTARRLISDHAATKEAVAELHLISRDPTLLGVAAGRALGRWEAIPLFNSLGQEIAALLLRAGADSETVRTTAEATARRLRIYLRR